METADDMERPKWMWADAKSYVELICDALNNHEILNEAFQWYLSPEGHVYWSNIRANGHTPESLDKLNRMLAVAEHFAAKEDANANRD